MTSWSYQAGSGHNFNEYTHIPDRVSRKRVGRTPHKRRNCRDNRPYVTVPWTITGDLVEGKWGPMWPADRDYWIAGAKATVGLDTGAHPDDGTPSGDPIHINLWVRRDGSDLGKIFGSDQRLKIPIDEHEDSITELGDGIMQHSQLDIHRLRRDDRVYPEIMQIGSGRPGNHLVIALELVPYPHPDRDEE